MNLRKAFFVVSFALTSMLLLIGGVTFGALSAFNEASAAARHRQNSMALMSEVHHEVGLLGRLVSSYINTADPRFLIYYYDILAIREGTKPRREGLTATYWEQVIAGTRSYEDSKSGEMLPLVERTGRLGFDAREQAVVAGIYQITERMKETEQVAFAATQGLYDPEAGEFVSEAEPHPEFAARLLHQAPYLKLRADLAVAVEELSSLVDQRTTQNHERASKRLQDWIFSALVLLLGAGAALIISYRYLEEHLLAPLTSLHRTAVALSRKDFNQRVGDLQGVEEVRSLAATIDGMAEAIEAELAHREAVELALKEARARAEVATEAKSIFLANMSHEIRTPMNAILGMAYLAMKSGLPPRQHDYVAKIHAAARSLLGILNDILDFSKIEAGKITLEATPFELESVVQNALVMVQQRAESKHLELIVDYQLPGNLPALVGDPLRLGQVLINLLTNAVKFTDAGHVRIAVSEAGRRENVSTLAFSVEDTGIGMSAAEMSRLFQEFSQADGSTTRKYGGTGLGLSISRRLVEAMGGNIDVESIAGRGSIFHFVVRLPLSATPAGRGEELRLPFRHALVVDDYLPSARSMAEMLRRMGCVEVELASGGGEALARLRALAGRGERCDLMLLDWEMPGLAGCALLQAVRDAGLAVPATTLVVSMADPTLLRAEVASPEIVDVIQKPLLPGALSRVCQGEPATGSERPVERRIYHPGVLNGMHILLVEDNDVNRQVAGEILRDWGATVDGAVNGQAALTWLDSQSPDTYAVVLLDIEMPVMDGPETLRRIRADERFRELPVIVMTAHAISRELDGVLAAGVSGYVAKPFEPDELLDLLYPFRRAEAVPAPPSPPAEAAIQGSEAHFAELLATIEAIDSPVLLARFANRLPFLGQTLQRFSTDAQELLAHLRQALLDGDPETARRDAHSLKGLAGTFAMPALHGAAAALEARLAADGEADTAALDLVAAGLSDVLAGLARLPEIELPEATAVPEPAALAEILATLRRHLIEGDGEVEELWRMNKQHLATLYTPLQFAAIERALGRWNFDEALAVLDNVPVPEEKT